MADILDIDLLASGNNLRPNKKMALTSSIDKRYL
jgi:hypothetical protein